MTLADPKRKDFELSPRASFRWVVEVTDEASLPYNLAGSTVELFIKPLVLTQEPSSVLSADISASAVALDLNPNVLSSFPLRGFVKIGDEIIRYAVNNGTGLAQLTRGDDETTPAAHLAAAPVRLAGRVLDIDGDVKERLLVEDAEGRITVRLHRDTINAFTWESAEYRLQITDTDTDVIELHYGQLTIAKRWAQ